MKDIIFKSAKDQIKLLHSKQISSYELTKAYLDRIEKYDDELPLNLGSSEEISIAELTKLICELSDYNGNVVWDKTKPNGQPRRCVSYQRAKEKIGFEPTTKLKDGLKKTIEWFIENQEKNVVKN